jgi:hypothetical protein
MGRPRTQFRRLTEAALLFLWIAHLAYSSQREPREVFWSAGRILNSNAWKDIPIVTISSDVPAALFVPAGWRGVVVKI